MESYQKKSVRCNIYLERFPIFSLLFIFAVSVFFFSAFVYAESSSVICDSGTQQTSCIISKPKVLNGEYTFKTLTIKKGGSITHDANRDSISNSLTINAETLTIDSGGSIDVSSKGYAGGATGSDGFGPGAGKKGALGGGGGHGGAGGGKGSTWGAAYDNVVPPTDAGSGGGGAVTASRGTGGKGGAGGGVVVIHVLKELALNGGIYSGGASGAAGTGTSRGGGGGAGGTVVLKVGTFSGKGTIGVSAGNGGGSRGDAGAGGGGGRVFLSYGLKTFAGKINIGGGAGSSKGAAGIVSQEDRSKIPCDEGTQDTTCVITSYKIFNGEYTFNTLIVENGGNITHDAIPKPSPKNAPETEKRMMKLIAQDLTIKEGGSINVNGRGYAGGESTTLSEERNKVRFHIAGFGPGGGTTAGKSGGGGGGHGWTGQPMYDGIKRIWKGAGIAYDSLSNPVVAGSGGGASSGDGCCTRGRGGTAGGGAVILDVHGTLTVDGIISADGIYAASIGGGGSGGTINILTNAFAGNGTLSAAGGKSAGAGGGAGGRIAVKYYSKPFRGMYNVKSGGARTYDGSIYEFNRATGIEEIGGCE